MKSIRKKVFLDSLGNAVGESFIQLLSRSLSGEIMKKFLMMIGDGNSGKGIITKALSNAFDSYHGIFSAEGIAYNANSTLEDSQKCRWILKLRFCRLIISNEVSQCKALDSFIIKKTASGGDLLVATRMRQEEEHFVPWFLPLIFCNDIKEIMPYDGPVDNRAVIIT